MSELRRNLALGMVAATIWAYSVVRKGGDDINGCYLNGTMAISISGNTMFASNADKNRTKVSILSRRAVRGYILALDKKLILHDNAIETANEPSEIYVAQRNYSQYIVLNERSGRSYVKLMKAKCG